MNADESAPATRRLNNASGILNAAQNASSCGVAPYVAPMTESRSQPSTRLATSAAIITIDARATDIVTCSSMRRAVGLSCLLYGNEEAKAFRTQAHPSDAATYHDQDPRPLGRTHRGEGSARRAHQGRRGG